MGTFSQIAGGVGKGLVQNVENRREDAAAEALRTHQETIQRMRDTASMERTERSGEIATEAYERQRGDIREDMMEKRKYEASLVPAAQRREDVIREDEQEHAIDIQAMKQYQSMTEAGSFQTKDGKWEMKVLTKGEMGPNGLPVEVDTFVVREPGTPFSYVQEGLNMLPHNYTDEQKEKALAVAGNPDETQTADIKRLMDSAGTERSTQTSSEFMRAYGFLPAEYFRAIRNSAQGPDQFQKFRRNFRQPAGMNIPSGSTESKTIRTRMEAPEDETQPFSQTSEDVMSTMTDEEYAENFKAAGGTDEQLAEAQRLGLLPSQRRGKLGMGGQLEAPQGGGKGVLSQGVEARGAMGPPAPFPQSAGLSNEELQSITDWIGSQMNPAASQIARR